MTADFICRRKFRSSPWTEIKALAALSYPERAAKIMKRYLDEFTEEELLGFAKSAYGPAKFDTPAAAPVVKLTENTYIQELWHGPTCAFKDMALQMLPYLLAASLKKTGEEKTVCILVATSGDTGKAALEGFRDVDRTKIPCVLSRRRRFRNAEAADGHAGGQKRRRMRRARATLTTRRPA